MRRAAVGAGSRRRLSDEEDRYRHINFIGVAIIVFSALQWAFFKAVSLGLTYLWRIQFELAHKADAD